MNREIFEGLLHDAVCEITDRHPEYFSHYCVDLPHSPDGLTQALYEGLDVLESLGVRARVGCEKVDDISRLITHSIIDAHAASRDEIALRPFRANDSGTDLSSRISLCRTRGEVQYAVTSGTQRPLLIVSATGIPLSIWSRLLDDREMQRRMFIVQTRGNPFFAGGRLDPSSLRQDVADIRQVLQQEELFDVDVVAWCNGSRVALELIRAEPARLASLVLLSPTFHGTVSAEDYPSPFEDSLPRMAEMLKRAPERAQFFLRCMSQVASPPDLETLRDHAEKRIHAVLSLPPHPIAHDLVYPFSTAEFFGNYAARIGADDAHDAAGALGAVRCPVLLVTGTHDTAINLRAARDLVGRCTKNAIHVSLHGGGHHIQWLQYDYFRYVLEHFLAGATPIGTARLTVEKLAA